MQTKRGSSPQKGMPRGWWVLLFAPWWGSAHAATLTVGSSGMYAAIQDAIDEASDGDIIEVDAGTYTEAIDFSGLELTITGTGGAESTVLMPPPGYDGVTVTNGESAAVMEGFSITPSGSRGIYIEDSSPSFIDCSIEGAGSSGSGQGGAVYADGGSPTFEGVDFVDNAALYGGDLFLTNGADVACTDCTFTGAYATRGGSLYLTSASLTLTTVVVDGASSLYSGGFAYLTDSILVAEDVTVSESVTDMGFGTGIYAQDHSDLYWTGGGFYANLATSYTSGYTGGAIFLEDSSKLIATDVTFEDNIAYSGGAVDITDSSSGTFTDCTFQYNIAENAGGALRVYDSSDVSCFGCMFDGNEGDHGGAVDVSVDAVFTDSEGTYSDNFATATVGGAIRLADDGELLVMESSFENNDAVQSGGALYLYRAAENVEITDTSFEGNESASGDGGAISATTDTSVEVIGCSFEENEASGGSGGAIAFDPGHAGTTLSVSDSSFRDNQAGDDGGAIWADEADEVNISDSDFIINEAEGGGGGLYLREIGDPLLKRLLFHYNIASGDGGAIIEDGTTGNAEVTNCRFSENVAENGGAYMIRDTANQTDLINNTMVGNDASLDGAHLYLDNGTVSFVNNIAWESQDGGGLYAADSPSADYSDFYYSDVGNNSGGDYTGYLADPEGVSGNISSDPLLQEYTIDGDETNDDLHLDLTSPCVDSGDPSIVDVDGTNSDMGAYGGPDSDGLDLDEDGYYDINDCDDSDDSIHPDSEETPYDGIDQDCNGTDLTDVDEDTYDAEDVGGLDCDDSDDSVNPSAVEIWYDGVDQDCDDANDYDADDDGYDHKSYSGTDCDDADSSINPGVTETWYDGVDQDCDGWSDYDRDLDGHDREEDGGNDCDDTDDSIHGAATEVAYDGIDQDCDGTDLTDADGDGWDAEAAGGLDCEDTDPESYPGAEEDPYDGVDNNCDGHEDYDEDYDGYVDQDHGGEDCDDTEPGINPDAEEVWYDGVDGDCSGGSDYDADEDGVDSDEYGGEDCDDNNATINPMTAEIWYDGVDQDCDGQSDFDHDGDGWDYAELGGPDADCDDDDPWTHPEADELYDGLDNDCDGYTELDDRDGDKIIDWEEWSIGTDHENPDSDGDRWLDGDEVNISDQGLTVTTKDTDGDGLIDPLDEDDDGDGIGTETEHTQDVDGDGQFDLDVDCDGVPNGLDRDSDGDQLKDEVEGVADRDRDGKADFVDFTGNFKGGGCSAMGRTTGVLWMAILAGVLLPRRRTTRARSFAWMGLIPVVGWLNAAHAAGTEDYEEIDVRGMWVADTASDPDRTFRLVYPLAATGWDAGMVMDVVTRPLVEDLPDGDEAIVELMASAHAYGGFEWKGIRFEGALPATLYGRDLEGGFTAAGDLRLGAMIPAFAPKKSRPGLGVQVSTWLPTGTAVRWSGSPGLAAGAVVAVAQELGAWGWTGNAGFRIARAEEARNIQAGPGPIGGFDVHYRIGKFMGLGAGVVTQGATGFQKWPLEATAHGRYRIKGGGFAALGAAAGLSEGVGSGSRRVVFAMGWGYRPPTEKPPPIVVPVMVSLNQHEAPTAILQDDKIVVSQQVFFLEGEAKLLPESVTVLEAVAALLQQHPEIQHLLIEGHTNSNGGNRYNRKLSALRAVSVVDWFVLNGVDGNRMLAKGFGEDRPLVDASHPDALLINRRVEFTVLRSDEGSGDTSVPQKSQLP